MAVTKDRPVGVPADMFGTVARLLLALGATPARALAIASTTHVCVLTDQKLIDALTPSLDGSGVSLEGWLGEAARTNQVAYLLPLKDGFLLLPSSNWTSGQPRTVDVDGVAYQVR